jgi:hypothetical protein
MNTSFYGHTSPETAYLVPDYPYGRKVRCRIRYWLEKDPKKGFRFVSQTENPKTLRWNAPKKSTYARFAGAMYVDGATGRVHWTGVSEYTSAAATLRIVSEHPRMDLTLLAPFVAAKVAFERRMAAGSAHFSITVNGVTQERSADERQADMDRGAQSLAEWEAVLRAVKACRDPEHADCARDHAMAVDCAAYQRKATRAREAGHLL